MKYAFLRDELSGSCTTRMACRLLEVSPSGYYHFLKAQLAPRKQRRLAIEQAVVRVHAESRRIYGAPKITHELPKLGLVAHRNTVSRMMQERGIRAKYAQNGAPPRRRAVTHSHRRQIFLNATSLRMDQTRNGSVTLHTFRPTKDSCIS